MIVSDWFAAALVLILSVLTIGVFAHIAIAVGQLKRARKDQTDARRADSQMSTTHFESGSPHLKHKTTFADAHALWSDLTKREIQVAHLAARGLTDAEIAAKLSISERTVGNHLYSIYRKLDINSRRELKYILQQLEADT